VRPTNFLPRYHVTTAAGRDPAATHSSRMEAPAEEREPGVGRGPKGVVMATEEGGTAKKRTCLPSPLVEK